MLEKELKKLTKELGKKYSNIKVSLKDDCVLLEGVLSNWDDVVSCGQIASKYDFYQVINEIKLKDFKEPEMRYLKSTTKEYDGLKVDVLVIGGGIIGCAILRELTKLNISCGLVEKEDDLARHASSRNDGCIHVGIDISNKTKKHYYLNKSIPLYKTLAKEIGVEYEEMGQILAFDSNLYRLIYPYLKMKIKKNNIKGARIVNQKELFLMEPNLNRIAKFGIFFPTGACICPYNTTIALAESAAINKAKVMLNTAVLDMVIKDGKIEKVITSKGDIYPLVVINAAGVFADKVAKMANDKFYTIHPRKGTNLILDKLSKTYLMRKSTSIYNQGKKSKRMHTKGGGIVPTIDGNVLVGPSAVETPFREDFKTDKETVDNLILRHRYTANNLSINDVITYFTGVRAATYKEDFIVQKGKWTKNIIHAAGIQSPGLTAAPAIAIDVSKWAKEILESIFQMKIEANNSFNPIRKPDIVSRKLPIEERDKLIKSNPNYGKIICRCEEISEQEIIDALNRPIKVSSIDSVKRRVRAGMGRCQGGFCQPLVAKIIARELKININDVYKKNNGKIILSDVKESESNV